MRILFAVLMMGSVAQAAVFGVDSRKAITEQSALQPFARATAIAVLSTNYSRNADGTLKLETGSPLQICADEKFGRDERLEYACTGFLVAPDLLVTAGHCVYAVNTPNKELKNETELACKALSWLFDYQDTSKGRADSKRIPADRLFGCKQIIYAKQTEKAPFVDYALIQLDRPAMGRTPFKMTSVRPAVGTPISMIGYPFGTPAKLSDQARVTLDTSSRDSFLTTLDAFSGNSGSPVFNGGGQVVGILVGGTPSYDTIEDAPKRCERLNRCNEPGTKCLRSDTPDEIAKFAGYQGVGSEVQRIEPILQLLKSLGR